jgi:predicted methyltransferase/DNA-directed RNA polymerase subunit RPC12/RpoP
VNDGRSDAIVREVTEAVGLAEGEAGVRDVIRVVRSSGPVATRTLSRATGLPVPIVAAIAGELRKRGIVTRDRPTCLTPQGRRLFGDAALGRILGGGSTYCDEHGRWVPQELEPVAAELDRISAESPPARSELDQSHCTAETKLRRALALHQAGALEGKRVILLGDDDLVAVAIHLLAAYADFADTVRELTVVDVDPAVLGYVGRQLENAAFPVRLVEHDLRRTLPSSLVGHFDTVFTDPPYTAAGVEVFLSRAASALASGPGHNVFLAYGPKPPAELLRFQRAVVWMGFVVRRIEPNFNEYLHSGILGGVSNLYHLTSTSETRPLVSEQYDEPIYTGALRAPRSYRCASCGTIQRVGRGAPWPTVDVLKRGGCPECGATRFLPLPRRTRTARP